LACQITRSNGMWFLLVGAISKTKSLKHVRQI
jgi:hypothetical protein